MSPVIARQVINRLRESDSRGQTAPTSAHSIVLSTRESEILDLISRGYTYAEISGYLSITVNTVASHIRNIYGKLAVNSRTEAVFEAHKLGLLKSL